MNDIDFKFPYAADKHRDSLNPYTLRQLRMIMPYRAVDVGPGAGFYGELIHLVSPRCFVIGVEAHEPYVSEWDLDKKYDKLIIGDIVEEIATDEIFGDLIVFGDVLEHLNREDIPIVLDASIQKFKYVLVNSPYGFTRQDHEISWEIHRSPIGPETFYKYDVIQINVVDCHINCLIGGNQ